MSFSSIDNSFEYIMLPLAIDVNVKLYPLTGVSCIIILIPFEKLSSYEIYLIPKSTETLTSLSISSPSGVIATMR